MECVWYHMLIMCWIDCFVRNDLLRIFELVKWSVLFGMLRRIGRTCWIMCEMMLRMCWTYWMECFVWNDLLRMCLIYSMEYVLFGMCFVWNVFCLECVLFGMCFVWNDLFVNVWYFIGDHFVYVKYQIEIFKYHLSISCIVSPRNF